MQVLMYSIVVSWEVNKDRFSVVQVFIPDWVLSSWGIPILHLSISYDYDLSITLLAYSITRRTIGATQTAGYAILQAT